jgi:Bacterial Ig-like domain
MQKPPIITYPEDNAKVSNDKLTIKGNADPNSKVNIVVEISDNGKLSHTVTSSSDGMWSYTLAPMLPDGIHKIFAIAIDTAGYPSPPSKTVTVTTTTVSERHDNVTSNARINEGLDKGSSKDYILKHLESLPDKWDLSKNTETLHIIAEKGDAIWVTNRVFEDIDRELIETEFRVKKSEHSYDIIMTIDILKPYLLAAVGPILTLLLKDIKEGLIRRRKKKLRENGQLSDAGIR